MHDTQEFLKNLALVLCVAAATTVVFQRLRQPVVFGYLLAGMIIGPHIPIPLVADQATVHTLAEMGVILLMFALGLEFSLRKLFQVGPIAGLIAVIQSSAMIWFGYLAGRSFGWTPMESVYTGVIIAISSTTIIVKAFAERGITGKFTDIVFGVLIFEDLIAIFLLAILTTVSVGSTVSADSLAGTTLRLAGFLAVLLGVGLLVIPRLIRAVVRLNRPETTLVASIGICFASALFALSYGYSVALGAFIAGSLVAESGAAKTVEHLVAPVRDMFAAIFFVAVGMLIDPALVGRHWVAVVVLTLVVILGKVVAVSSSAFLTGSGIRSSVQTGMSLAQIGEFSFIIAGVGLSTGATRDFLYPVAVGVSALTTLTTPWLIRASGPAAALVDRKLPRPLQTFAALYGTWIARLRSAPAEGRHRSRVRRQIGFLVLDSALLAGIVLVASLQTERVMNFLIGTTGLSRSAARWVFAGAAVGAAVPLVIGLVRIARFLGLELALRALPASEEGKVDLAAAPRRALIATLQLAVLGLVLLPLLAVSQPFLPAPGVFAAVIGALMIILGISFWRSATNLQGHVRAGSEIIMESLAQQMAAGGTLVEDRSLFEQLQLPVPGLGEPVMVRLSPGCCSVDRTLAQIDLRGLTGAIVLAIRRADGTVTLPVGREVLRAGDVLVLAGTDEAVKAAATLLRTGSAMPDRAEPEPSG